MKKFLFVVGGLLALSLIIAGCEKMQDLADDQSNDVVMAAKKANPCATIQSGTLVASDGSPITTGYDQWGYNYQAHMFNGDYCAYDRDISDCLASNNDKLMMKWNEAWLSNKDCDGDGLLDRHYGFPSYRGSGAWLTNHMSGTYLDANGNPCNWTYFVKIVAAPLDAVKIGGDWYNANNVLIGPAIWGDFAIIQEVSNDPCAGVNGLQFASPDHPGLGGW